MFCTHVYGYFRVCGYKPENIREDAGLDLEQEGQDDTEASESADFHSPTKALNSDKPCNYLSAMLTYIAQVGTHAADPATPS